MTRFLVRDLVKTNVNCYNKADSWSYINYLDTGNLTNNVISEIVKLIPGEDIIPSRAKRKVKKGDILYSTVRPNQCHYGYMNNPYDNMLVSTGYAVLEPIKDKVCGKYLYYYLTQKEIVEYLHNIAEGTVSTYPSVQPKDIEKINVDIPDLETQNKIASILSNYDELIEKNNRKIEILQEMAEELYKEWFVRFRFPGYKTAKFTDGIPDGWEKVRLKNIVHEVGKSVNPKDRNDYKYYVPIDCISSHSMVLREVDCIENAESSLTAYKKGDILFGAIRPYFHKVVRAPFDGLTRKTCFVLNSYDSITHYYAYMLLFQKETISYATTISVGSTMPYVRWEDFERMNCILPKKEILLKFNNLMETYCNNLELLQCEIDLLKQQRDLLLPRLMSGKLEVKGDAHA